MSAGDPVSHNDEAAAERDRLEAAADRALAEAEYEFYALREALQAALAVPLRDRAIADPHMVSAEAAETDMTSPTAGASSSALASAAA